MSRTIQAIVLFFILPLFILTAVSVEARAMQAGAEHRNLTDGVFTSAQAARGKDQFLTNCSSCHSDDLSGLSAPALKGGKFINDWREDRLSSLFNLIKTTMPQNREKLAESAYLDILSYILETNTFPAGDMELTASAVGNIQFVGKDGPQPVPEYALVSVVGCLTQTAEGVWMLTKASDPIRTRREKPTEVELKAAGSTPLGNQIFRLVYADSFSPGFQIDTHKGHKMEGRGYLLRNAIDQRITVSWLEMIGTDCSQ